jgi:hypothetical protein
MLNLDTRQSAMRLLYFDEQPASCTRAIDAADDIRLPIQTVSHPEALHDACRAFKPSAVLAILRPDDLQALRVFTAISVAGSQIPVLIAGDVDIGLDGTIGKKVKSLDLDVRGSVRIGGSLRDLQFALLCAIARLHEGPIA